jgi:hypothetical protein
MIFLDLNIHETNKTYMVNTEFLYGTYLVMIKSIYQNNQLNHSIEQNFTPFPTHGSSQIVNVF